MKTKNLILTGLAVLGIAVAVSGCGISTISTPSALSNNALNNNRNIKNLSIDGFTKRITKPNTLFTKIKLSNVKFIIFKLYTLPEQKQYFSAMNKTQGIVIRNYENYCKQHGGQNFIPGNKWRAGKLIKGYNSNSYPFAYFQSGFRRVISFSNKKSYKLSFHDTNFTIPKLLSEIVKSNKFNPKRIPILNKDNTINDNGADIANILQCAGPKPFTLFSFGAMSWPIGEVGAGAYDNYTYYIFVMYGYTVK